MTLPFVTAVWAQNAASAAKWRARGFNTLFGHNTESGHVPKAQWEAQVAAAGMMFVTAPGDDVAAEAKQPGRIGFLQPDEPDLVTHVNLPGSRIKDLKATYERCAATGVPVWINLNGSSFDNVWYDGTPHPTKTDGSLAGHRAATGGYMAWGDVVGFDYPLWTTDRAGLFDITRRLMDRCNDWSGGKPIFAYVELCTQGTGRPFTADDYQAQVDTVTGYAKEKGYKLAGIVGFPLDPNGKAGWPGSFDIAPPDVVARMPIVNARLTGTPAPVPPPPPPPADPVAAIQAQVTEHQRRLDRIEAGVAAFSAALKGGVS
jgi:hypothetical protein